MRRSTEPRAAVRNASDPQQVKRAKESERARAEREQNDDFTVWNTVEGRAFTRRLLEECGVYRCSMVNDPHWTAFNEGARNIGLKLLARMTTTAHEAYLLMEREHAALENLTPSAPESTSEESDEPAQS